ncbi:MAG: cell wall-binding repeat-containing protein [Coriobacteriia bacterium]|nr:cell wall-binding repeat-containing protein [Coriobacteriia bacterium]
MSRTTHLRVSRIVALLLALALTMSLVPQAFAAYPIEDDPDYYPKELRHTPTIDDEFEDDRVIVVIKHAYSGINKVWTADDFKVRGIEPMPELDIGSFKQSDIVEIVDLFHIDDPENNDLVNRDGFHQILSIRLGNPGKENVLAAIIALEELDCVLGADPVYTGYVVDRGNDGTIGREPPSDRYKTAIEASKANFESADSVIIATGMNYADALSASALAGSLDAPLLLTRSESLSFGVLDEINRLGAKNVYVMGSAAAVSDTVVGTLKGAGLTVERIAGTDRYQTSAAIAQKVADIEGAAFAKKAFLARGDNFADGLAVSPLAYQNKIPVVLTRPTELPATASGVISGLGINDVTILGSAAAVSAGIEASVGRLATTRRVAGADRYETAQKIAEYALDNSLATKGFIGVATGLNFPDALAGVVRQRVSAEAYSS